MFGFLVHVDVAHVDVDSELFDAHPNGSTRWRRRHVNELDAARRETHLLPRVHNCFTLIIVVDPRTPPRVCIIQFISDLIERNILLVINEII